MCELQVEIVRQAPGGPLDRACVDPDMLGVAFLDDLSQEWPLLLLELPSVGPVVEVLGVGARDVDAFDGLALARVVKD